MKLATNIHHVSGHCWIVLKVRGQGHHYNVLKVRGHGRDHNGGGIHLDGVALMSLVLHFY